MTFFGHFIAKADTQLPDLLWPLVLFVVGVLLDEVMLIFAFLTQRKSYHEP